MKCIKQSFRDYFLMALITLFLTVPLFSQMSAKGSVTNVLDGHTLEIRLANNHFVVMQLQAIETPIEGQELADIVHEHLEKLVLNKQVTVIFVGKAHDMLYGRVYLNNIDLSQQLLRDGAAWLIEQELTAIPKSVQSSFFQMQELAQNEKRGVWSFPDLLPPSKMREMVYKSADPFQDKTIINAAWRSLGSSVEGVFGSESYSQNDSSCSGKVVGVVDGDTVRVLTASQQTVTVRLAGIDAPEKSQDYGLSAKKTLSDMIFGKIVNCESSKKDRYGRVIGKLFLNGQDINLEMIKRCHAWHYKEYQNEQSASDREKYSAAESSARANQCGMWKNNPITPSDFRRNRFSVLYQTHAVAGGSGNVFVGGSAGSYTGSSGGSGGTVRVRSYTRRDGTVVRSHSRSSPR
jgi:endonuclease YncB( thermonuclease family)